MGVVESLFTKCCSKDGQIQKFTIEPKAKTDEHKAEQGNATACRPRTQEDIIHQKARLFPGKFAQFSEDVFRGGMRKRAQHRRRGHKPIVKSPLLPNFKSQPKSSEIRILPVIGNSDCSWHLSVLSRLSNGVVLADVLGTQKPERAYKKGTRAQRTGMTVHSPKLPFCLGFSAQFPAKKGPGNSRPNCSVRFSQDIAPKHRGSCPISAQRRSVKSCRVSGCHLFFFSFGPDFCNSVLVEAILETSKIVVF